MPEVLFYIAIAIGVIGYTINIGFIFWYIGRNTGYQQGLAVFKANAIQKQNQKQISREQYQNNNNVRVIHRNRYSENDTSEFTPYREFNGRTDINRR